LTRKLRLTNQGEQFLQHCKDALGILDNAYAELQNNDAELTGTIRMSAPSDLGRNCVLRWLDDFMQTHPTVDLHLRVSDGHVDLYGQQIDLALRYGSPKDSSLIALPIVLDNRPVLCASPAYLEKFGEPKTASALAKHNCLCLGHNDKYFSQWTFEGLDKQTSAAVSGKRW